MKPSPADSEASPAYPTRRQFARLAKQAGLAVLGTGILATTGCQVQGKLPQTSLDEYPYDVMGNFRPVSNRPPESPAPPPADSIIAGGIQPVSPTPPKPPQQH